MSALTTDERLARIEGMLGPIETMLVTITRAVSQSTVQVEMVPGELVDAAEAMRLMGYTDRDAFNRACRRERIARVRFNARKYGYKRSELARWIAARGVRGGA